MITAHPRRNATHASRAPLQLVSRCHVPGDLRRQIYPARRKDQKLLSPDTDVQKSSIHHRNTQGRGGAGQQSPLCPGRGPSRGAQPKCSFQWVTEAGATRKGLAQPPLAASLSITPTLPISIVRKAPTAPAQPPNPSHSSQRQIFPLPPSSQASCPGWESCWWLSSVRGAELSLALLISLIPQQLLRVALAIFRRCWELPGLSHLRRFHSFSLSPLHHTESEGLFGCWMRVPMGLCKPE